LRKEFNRRLATAFPARLPHGLMLPPPTSHGREKDFSSKNLVRIP